MLAAEKAAMPVWAIVLVSLAAVAFCAGLAVLMKNQQAERNKLIRK